MRTETTRFGGRLLLLGTALLLLVTGCGGLHVTKSISPLDFLLPGMGSLLHVDNRNLQPSTNAVVACSDVPVK